MIKKFPLLCSEYKLQLLTSQVIQNYVNIFLLSIISTPHLWLTVIKCHVQFGKQRKGFFAIAAVIRMTYNDDSGMIIDTKMEGTEDENISCKSIFVNLSMTPTKLKGIGRHIGLLNFILGRFYTMLLPSVQIPIYDGPVYKVIPSLNLQLSGKYQHRTCLCVVL